MKKIPVSSLKIGATSVMLVVIFSVVWGVWFFRQNWDPLPPSPLVVDGSYLIDPTIKIYGSRAVTIFLRNFGVIFVLLLFCGKAFALGPKDLFGISSFSLVLTALLVVGFSPEFHFGSDFGFRQDGLIDPIAIYNFSSWFLVMSWLIVSIVFFCIRGFVRSSLE